MDTQSNASDLVRLWQGQNPITQAQMRCFHDELIQYLENPEATLFVRGRPTDRRKTFVTDNGLLIAPTDNSPAWWAHKMVSTPNSVIDFKRIPTHMFDTGRDGFNTINRNGYYVAHIIAAKIGTPDFTQWSREDAVARFVCNIHPINHFYVPMEHRNLGENPEFILAAARLAEEMYGGTWNEFVEFAGDSGLQYLINLTNKPSQTFAHSIPRQSQQAPVLGGASGRVEYSST